MNAAIEVAGRPALPEGPFLVCGLARSGQAVAKALAERGEKVFAVDSAEPDGAAGLAGLGVELQLNAAGDDLIGQIRTLVKSPGVPQHAPAVLAARAAGVKVLGELELGWRMVPGRVIAVTGTNGKTTVSQMIGHVLREAGTSCTVVGNVGTPLSALAGGTGNRGTLVVEASSFQLEDAEKFAPDVALLLNISPDHLDRHGTMASYRSAKLKIFECQGEGSIAVVPEAESRGDIGGSADVLSFGEDGAEMTVADGALHWQGREILASGELALPGRHNLLNAAAAGTACIAAGVAPDVVGRALRSFAGVAHRLELVLDRDGVRWINDSKATNVDSTLTALLAVEGPVRLILGGQGKGQDFSALAERVATTCASVHLIGEATDALADALKATGVGMSFDLTLGAAVKSCSAEARAGESVLLSPACASFDQFADFEDRGDQFRRLVEEFAE